MATNLQLKNKLFLDSLPKATEGAFLQLSKLSFLSAGGWYLAGGTALALQAGHRQSVDLDFFTTKKKFDELSVERVLQNTGKWQTTYRESGTIYGVFDNAKVSLIAYPFFRPSGEKIKHGSISVLSQADVASMKIIAISQRGRKRDFYDLYWYCQNREQLYDVVLRSVNQYPGQSENINHIIKSLSYFADAENDPEPTLFFKASWMQVKSFFVSEAKNLMKRFKLVSDK